MIFGSYLHTAQSIQPWKYRKCCKLNNFGSKFHGVILVKRQPTTYSCMQLQQYGLWKMRSDSPWHIVTSMTSLWCSRTDVYVWWFGNMKHCTSKTRPFNGEINADTLNITCVKASIDPVLLTGWPWGLAGGIVGASVFKADDKTVTWCGLKSSYVWDFIFLSPLWFSTPPYNSIA